MPASKAEMPRAAPERGRQMPTLLSTPRAAPERADNAAPPEKKREKKGNFRVVEVENGGGSIVICPDLKDKNLPPSLFSLYLHAILCSWERRFL